MLTLGWGPGSCTGSCSGTTNESGSAVLVLSASAVLMVTASTCSQGHVATTPPSHGDCARDASCGSSSGEHSTRSSSRPTDSAAKDCRNGLCTS